MRSRLFIVLLSLCASSFPASPLLGQTPQKPAPKAPSKSASPAPKTTAAPQAMQSTHYPILLLGHGGDPFWNVLIGQKGPERFERANYPPMALEAVSVNGEGADAWTYHAKDSATAAEVTIRLTREACTDAAALAAPENPGKTSAAPAKSSSTTPNPSSPVRYTFSITLQHAQVGSFKGCARIAAELFPKIVNQTAEDDDDADKKKPPVTTITNFKVPTAVAFVNPGGKITISRGTAKKIIPASGTELSLSHDGKKLLYTRNDAKMGSERTIVLYEYDSGRSKDLARGTVRQAFWSTDDSHIAYLQSQDQKWRVVSAPSATPESASAVYNGSVDSLNGWADAHTVLAGDAQNAYWIGDDRPQQTLSLREIYGDAFRISDTDTMRVNPVNPDLLLVSAKYATPPAGGPADAAGIFLYEIRAKRRVTLTPPEQWASHGEFSRDGVQIFYTRRMSATSSAVYRVFWDGSGVKRYLDGTDLVVGQ
jgi:uncharacterized membrane protein